MFGGVVCSGSRIRSENGARRARGRTTSARPYCRRKAHIRCGTHRVSGRGIRPARVRLAVSRAGRVSGLISPTTLRRCRQLPGPFPIPRPPREMVHIRHFGSLQLIHQYTLINQ